MSEFSKCELVVSLSDGDTMSVPINFGAMSDNDIRKIYPHFLSVSDPCDNPMIQLEEVKKSEKWQHYTEEDRADIEKWYHDMAKYWYNKPSTSLLDVAIGIALDIKLNGLKVMSISDNDNEIDTRYEGNLKKPVEDNKIPLSNISDSDVEKYIDPHGVEKTVNKESSINNGTMSGLMIDIYGDDDSFDEMFNEMNFKQSVLHNLQAMNETTDNTDRINRMQLESNTELSADDRVIEYDKNGIMINSNIVSERSIEFYPDEDDFIEDMNDNGGGFEDPAYPIESENKVKSYTESEDNAKLHTDNSVYAWLNGDECDE